MSLQMDNHQSCWYPVEETKLPASLTGVYFMDILNISDLSCESIGEPGKRTFRIIGSGDGGYAVVWLEKEQLLQLALAVQQYIANPPNIQGEEYSQEKAADTTNPLRLEFKAERIAIGHVNNSGQIVIDFHEVQDVPRLRFSADPKLLHIFAEDAISVCAAGRPLCQLCGELIDLTGHVCPRNNGHHASSTGETKE
jgi:uncharacterized repeat protein (TIGR03847 family)